LKITKESYKKGIKKFPKWSYN